MYLLKRFTAIGATAIVAVTGAFLIDPFEGNRNNAYTDMVGIVTICRGETRGVKLGDYRTNQQCDSSTVKELTAYNKAMLKYVKVELEPYEEVAYTSFVWNLGETNFKNSTMLKKLNAGDHIGACNEFPKWNKAGGVEVKGLTNRRLSEREVCLGNNQAVNDALKALEAVKTAPEKTKNVSQGLGVGEANLSVSKPSGTTK